MRQMIHLVLILLFLAFGASGHAQLPYSVLVGTYTSESDARAAESKIKVTGEKPTYLVTANGETQLCYGAFSNYVDALLYKQELRTNPAFQDAHIVANTSASLSETPLSNLKPVFDRDVLNVDMMGVKSLNGNAVYEELEKLDTTESKSLYEQALRKQLPLCSQDDPLRGYIHTNLGIAEIIRGDYNKALEHLVPVANGDVPSAASNRVMAMIRCAWIWHQQKDRLRAYQAYRQIEGFSRSPAVVARCKAESMGLLLELSESGKGTHEDFRAEAQRALDSIPQEIVKHRAVIELMMLESYARQPKPDLPRAIELAEAFLRKYENSPDKKTVEREIAAAMVQAGMFHFNNGDYTAAENYYNRVLREFPHDVDRFAGAHPHAEAMLGMSNLARVEGRIAESNILRLEIIRDFPNEEATRRILAGQPYLASNGGEQ